MKRQLMMVMTALSLAAFADEAADAACDDACRKAEDAARAAGWQDCAAGLTDEELPEHPILNDKKRRANRK